MVRESIGPYRILRKLGEGGMGEVYEAMDDRIKRRVAIKLLRSRHLDDPDTASRFFTEALAVNLIEHPGVVQIHEYGQLQDGCAYLVMEYLNGETLADRLKKRSARLNEKAVLSLAQQLASALVAAHEQSIVHRDLKPGNIMLITDPAFPEEERVKLLDFGIAKLTNETLGLAKQLTVTGRLIGTPRYMSPEQCRGQRDLDGKSDVYSLGVLLYELLAGQPPFLGVSEYDTLAKHLYDPPLPLASLRPSLSKSLVALIHRMLEKNKEDRPDMKEVLAELKQHRHGRASQPEVGEPSIPTPTAISKAADSAESSEPTDSGVEPASLPPPTQTAAPAAPTVRAPIVRRKPAGPPAAGSKGAPPTVAEMTLIAGGPNAATVPVAAFSRNAQARWLKRQRQVQLTIAGALATFLLVVILYLILR